MKHLIDFVGGLEERKIGFRGLQESLDTTTSGGMLVFHIFAALAEFERNLIQERRQVGLAAARAWGRRGGRPKAFDKQSQRSGCQTVSWRRRFCERNLPYYEHFETKAL